MVDRSDAGGKTGQAHGFGDVPEFRRYYQAFEGRISLPRFCVKQGNRYEALDYFRHLVSQVAVDRFDYAPVDEWDMAAALKEAKDSPVSSDSGTR